MTGDGLVALNKAGQIGRGEPGSLRVVRSEPAARWFGPKHYWTPSGWVLAGLHSFKRLSDGVTFRDSFTADPTHRSPRSAPVHVWDIERTVSLRALPVDGTVGPSGWIDPLFIR